MFIRKSGMNLKLCPYLLCLLGDTRSSMHIYQGELSPSCVNVFKSVLHVLQKAVLHSPF